MKSHVRREHQACLLHCLQLLRPHWASFLWPKPYLLLARALLLSGADSAQSSLLFPV